MTEAREKDPPAAGDGRKEPPPAVAPAPAAAKDGRREPAPVAPAKPGPGYVVEDGPLLLLALVLAVMLWNVVRDKLETTGAIEVTVSIKAPPEVVVYHRDSKVATVTLRGPRGEVNRARAALGDPPMISVQLKRAEIRGPQGTRLFNSPEDFRFPFESTEVVSGVSAVSVDWEMAHSQDVQVARPKIEGAKALGYEVVDVTVDPPTTVRVTGPESVVKALREIEPDPVDATRWLETRPDLTNPMQWTQKFEAWLETGAWAGIPNARRDRETLRIAPSRVSGTVRFRETTSTQFEHPLWVLLPTVYEGWTHNLQGGAEYVAGTAGTPPRVTYLVRGETGVLEHMRENRDDWTFQVALPPPPDPDGPPIENRPVTVQFHALAKDLKDRIRRAGGAEPTIEGEALLYLTWTKR